MVMPMQKISLRTRRLFADLVHDRSGMAATEFAMIAPLMLVLFFGVLEFSSAIAVDRKVTLVSRTMADLTSQSTSVSDTDLANFKITAQAMMTPYVSTPLANTPLNSTITELWIDPATSNARVQWSKGTSPHNPKDVIAIPSNLIAKDSTGKVIAGQYLIFSEVNYVFTPAVDYAMSKTGITFTLKDSAYTRPRQTSCVIYPTPTSGVWPTCPTL
jgi:Flp pilus assembly protein TadG